MRGVSFQSVGEVQTVSMADPVIEGLDEAIVRVSMAGLCGSDLHPFWGREAGLEPGTVMGHELVGRVVAVGGGVDAANLAVGDRVYVPFSTNCGRCHFCQIGLTSRCELGQLFGWRQRRDSGDVTGLHGCQSELVRVPLANGSLKRLPESVSDEAALLLGDNFSTGFFCAEMAEVKPGGTYVVIGCGTVGQLCILAAQSMGAESIIAVDLVQSRREQAEQLGAIPACPENAMSEVQAQTAGHGADAVMELVGMPDAQRLAYQLVRPGGIMSVIGCHCSPHFSFSPVDAYDKNLIYKTGRCPARHYMDRLTDRVAEGEFDLSSFVTHRFDLTDSVEAYDVFSHRRDGCIKAVFQID